MALTVLLIIISDSAAIAIDEDLTIDDTEELAEQIAKLPNEFTIESVEENKISENSFSRQVVSLEKIEAKVLNERKLSTTIYLVLKIELSEESEIDVVTDIEGKDKQKLEKKYNIKNILTRKSVSSSLNDVLKINDDHKIIEILKIDIEVALKETKMSFNKLLAKSEINIKVIYLDENKSVKMIIGTFPLMTFIETENVSDNYYTDFDYIVRNVFFKIQNEGNSIEFQIDFEIRSVIFEEKELNILKDVYSVEKNLKIESENVNIELFNKENDNNYYNIRIDEKYKIDNIVNVVEKYHFDGIDLDWEYPGWFTPGKKDSEAENYNLLCQELKAALSAKNEEYLLTAAIPGGSEGFKRYDLAECSKYLDYIHIMTYDLEASSKVYHHTAVYSNVGKGTAQDASVDSSVYNFTFNGVPKSKIVVGVAFYGKYTVPESSTKGGLGGNSANSKYTTLTYGRIKSMFLNRIGSGVTEYWDSTCCAPYLYDADNNYFITYENEKSINEKAKYVRKNGLAGIMIWELGEDSDDGDLMSAVISSMR